MNAIRIHSIAILSALILSSCGREEAAVEKAQWTFQEDKAHSLEANQSSTRPFALTSEGGTRAMTLDQYINALYHETSGRGATSSETKHWVKLYASGRGIQDVVNGIVNATSSSTEVMSGLERKFTAENGEREKGRGFSSSDMMLFYYLSMRPSTTQYSSYSGANSYLPFFMSSKQYTKYLFWSYILTGGF